MDRRKFLGLLGGGLVASATMADADRLVDFLKWLKKGPTEYSFASPRPIPVIGLETNTLAILQRQLIRYEGKDANLWQAMFFYAK
jgi:hypothetical protein